MIAQILITALLSAVLTLLAVAVAYFTMIRPAMEKRLQLLAEEMERRVRRGVVGAGEELLPAFRQQVRRGFREAFSNWPSDEFRQATKTGADLVEDGLNTLFKRRRDR